MAGQGTGRQGRKPQHWQLQLLGMHWTPVLSVLSWHRLVLLPPPPPQRGDCDVRQGRAEHWEGKERRRQQRKTEEKRKEKGVKGDPKIILCMGFRVFVCLFFECVCAWVSKLVAVGIDVPVHICVLVCS